MAFATRWVGAVNAIHMCNCFVVYSVGCLADCHSPYQINLVAHHHVQPLPPVLGQGWLWLGFRKAFILVSLSIMTWSTIMHKV
ncbi:hypothetical protein FA15DRAFT_665410 [Coprinopsis marcescibilis]|uniref:Uncharacterized protein n=1 Tax=Coprinopsis marcescibilis TaxID=230819 RepID=A0A5C3L5Y5_COPMA|nr:hypothetical protein FA15DRAFT_665410 [Coprinopsis marcescibilis]